MVCCPLGQLCIKYDVMPITMTALDHCIKRVRIVTGIEIAVNGIMIDLQSSWMSFLRTMIVM